MATPTTAGNPVLKSFAIQVDETNQIRIRINEWKGKYKISIQNFFKPGPNSTFPANPDGYAYGKVVSFPVDKWSQFVKLIQYADKFYTANQPAIAKLLQPKAPAAPTAADDTVVV